MGFTGWPDAKTKAQSLIDEWAAKERSRSKFDFITSARTNKAAGLNRRGRKSAQPKVRGHGTFSLWRHTGWSSRYATQKWVAIGTCHGALIKGLKTVRLGKRHRRYLGKVDGKVDRQCPANGGQGQIQGPLLAHRPHGRELGRHRSTGHVTRRAPRPRADAWTFDGLLKGGRGLATRGQSHALGHSASGARQPTMFDNRGHDLPRLWRHAGRSQGA